MRDCEIGAKCNPRRKPPAAVLGATLLFAVLSSCAPKQDRAERFLENGVEVVINNLKPQKDTRGPLNLRIEEEFSVDTESKETDRKGLFDIDSFDVDSSGNIYFFKARDNDLNLVYKFDERGQYVSTFGRQGQGPDEIQAPVFLGVCNKDEIWIQDYGSKISVFDSEGDLINQIRQNSQENFANYPLANGNFLRFRDYTDPESKHRFDILILCDPAFKEIMELGRCDYGPGMRFIQGKKQGTPHVFIFRVSSEKIYLGDEGRDYEISVFDENGALQRKIRKKFRPADAPEEFHANLITNWGRYKDKLILPDKMPPFHYFFLDEDGRLYVKTYEPGEKRGEFIHDIFNSDGVFIARKSLAGYGLWMYPGRDLNTAKAKNGRLYCIREKENGFKELVVYKMIWE